MEGHIAVDPGPETIKKRKEKALSPFGIKSAAFATAVVVLLVELFEFCLGWHRKRLLESATKTLADFIGARRSRAIVDDASENHVQGAATKEASVSGGGLKASRHT